MEHLKIINKLNQLQQFNGKMSLQKSHGSLRFCEGKERKKHLIAFLKNFCHEPFEGFVIRNPNDKKKLRPFHVLYGIYS